MGRHGGRPSLDRFPGCKGLQPSKVNNGLRGPDHDLEGAGPISANLFCKISALAIRVSGLVRLALRPFDSSFQLGV